MKSLYTTILLFTFSSLFGQVKTVNGIISSNGDTSYLYKYQLKQIHKLSLPLLDTTLIDEYFRVWTNRQVIDIWQNADGETIGHITTWTDEYVSHKEDPTNRTFLIKNKLAEDTAMLIRKLMYSSNILTLPTDDSIKGWRQGVDGIVYIIESSNRNKYSIKTYWTPKAQDSLMEAKQVQEFIDGILKLTNAQNAWKEFSNKIPYECYINGGPGVACKVLTKSERKKYVKERKLYRQRQNGS